MDAPRRNAGSAHHSVPRRGGSPGGQRAHALRQAADAYVLDNTHMTLHEELVWVMGLLQGKFAILESPGLSC